MEPWAASTFATHSASRRTFRAGGVAVDAGGTAEEPRIFRKLCVVGVIYAVRFESDLLSQDKLDVVGRLPRGFQREVHEER